MRSDALIYASADPGHLAGVSLFGGVLTSRMFAHASESHGGMRQSKP